MKYVFYECDECMHGARPGLTDVHARALALEDGFGFLNKKCYCCKCLEKLPAEQQKKARVDQQAFTD